MCSKVTGYKHCNSWHNDAFMLIVSDGSSFSIIAGMSFICSGECTQLKIQAFQAMGKWSLSFLQQIFGWRNTGSHLDAGGSGFLWEGYVRNASNNISYLIGTFFGTWMLVRSRRFFLIFTLDRIFLTASAVYSGWGRWRRLDSRLLVEVIKAKANKFSASDSVTTKDFSHHVSGLLMLVFLHWLCWFSIFLS